MPVILDADGIDAWLNPDSADADLATIFGGAATPPLEAVEVSRRVNSPANEGPELILPAQR